VARILQGSAEDLQLLGAALRQGQLVAAPTETVYGLAANGLDPLACSRIFEAKQRPFGDPLILHVLDLQQAEDVAVFNPAAHRLVERFWPGPLTLVLPKRSCVPDVATSGRSSVAVRSPRHPLFRQLIEAAGRPLAAPSANPFGYVSPTTAEHVEASLGERIPYILDGGPCEIGLESTIVDLRDPEDPAILRPGAITSEELQAALGRPFRTGPVALADLPKQEEGAVAPGLLERHYSPRTPLKLADAPFTAADFDQAGEQVAFLCFRRPDTAGEDPRVHWLSEDGSAAVAGQRLFAMLRQLDAAGYQEIRAELAPGEGLAHAINDRLRRAAAKR
jgi:L-threonylcarbamoyladenylate synthase